MGMIKEFREFAMKGNVVDMAVGVIIGGAFGKIVSSLVSDVIMPPLGLVIGGVNFTGLAVELKAGAEGVPPVMFKYGAFIQQVFDFAIVAFAMFLLIKAINRVKRQEVPAAPATPPPPPADIVLLTEIRDLLKGRK